jgi:hypothetical protein
METDTNCIITHSYPPKCIQTSQISSRFDQIHFVQFISKRLYFIIIIIIIFIIIIIIIMQPAGV